MKVLFASAALVALAPAIAQAQDAAPQGVYANLGYAHASQSGISLGAVQGKLGYRINKWVGVEGELAIGFDDDSVRVGAATAKVELKHEAAAYVVGFAPVGPNTDLLARIGYGTTKIGASAVGASASGSDESINVGVGVQHHFDGKNGVRVEYTRSEYNDGGHANLWGVAYSRRF